MIRLQWSNNNHLIYVVKIISHSKQVVIFINWKGSLWSHNLILFAEKDPGV